VPGRVLDHTMGAYVVTPLVTSDGTTALVLRGWVRDGAVVPKPPGRASVTGTLRPYENSSAATLGPTARYAATELPYLGRRPLMEAIELDTTTACDGFLVLSAQQPEDPDGPTPVPLDIAAPRSGVGTWQHFSYWAQWWIFAGAALAFWGVLVRNAVRERQSL
jgi:cytochrome oxidase assembly protein ShyY1